MENIITEIFLISTAIYYVFAIRVNVYKEDLSYENIRLYCINSSCNRRDKLGLNRIFEFDLVKAIFGDMTWVSRIIYALVGIAGLYSLSFFGRLRNED